MIEDIQTAFLIGMGFGLLNVLIILTEIYLFRNEIRKGKQEGEK